MNRHFFGVGPSTCQRIDPFSSEVKLLFNELRSNYIQGTTLSPPRKLPCEESFCDDLVSSSTHTDSEDSEFNREIEPITDEPLIVSQNSERKSKSNIVDQEKFDTIPSIVSENVGSISYSPQRILEIRHMTKKGKKLKFPFVAPKIVKLLQFADYLSTLAYRWECL